MNHLFTATLVGTLFAMIGLELTGSDNDLDRNERVFIEQLIRQMTLEEKAGQLTQLGMQLTATGPMIDTKAQHAPDVAAVGSVLGVYGAENTRKVQQQAVQGSRLHIPLLFSFDVIHGFPTVFPVPLAEASATWFLQGQARSRGNRNRRVHARSGRLRVTRYRFSTGCRIRDIHGLRRR
ncbi:glycoside hydrolase family 3 N-terminal domain-containing protein [Pseudomonas corrugata]